MHEVMREYLMTKISVQTEPDWLVLDAMMLIYCPSAWSLEESRTRNRSKHNLEWPNGLHVESN